MKNNDWEAALGGGIYEEESETVCLSNLYLMLKVIYIDIGA